MNPRTRRLALYAIAAIAIAASGNALAHSYAGLYAWAAHHRLTGWQAVSWPAEIDVFLAIGELALYVAYLDAWPTRQRVWPWATALVGLVVSVAGNIGHIQPLPGHPVTLDDRLTAATSPLAAFAGLTVGLLVLRMNRQQAAVSTQATGHAGRLIPLPSRGAPDIRHHRPGAVTSHAPASRAVQDEFGSPGPSGMPQRDVGADGEVNPDPRLLRDAEAIYQTAAARGELLSQRTLARQLRGRGHRFPNQHLRGIAAAARLDAAHGQASLQGR